MILMNSDAIFTFNVTKFLLLCLKIIIFCDYTHSLHIAYYKQNV